MTGPLVEEQVEFGPVSVQLGATVGAMDPATPVMVAVYVMIWPELPVDCNPVTETVGVP